MRKALPNRSVMLLDESTMPFLKWFRSTPTAESLHQMTTSQPALPAAAPGAESPAAKPPVPGK